MQSLDRRSRMESSQTWLCQVTHNRNRVGLVYSAAYTRPSINSTHQSVVFLSLEGMFLRFLETLNVFHAICIYMLTKPLDPSGMQLLIPFEPF